MDRNKIEEAIQLLIEEGYAVKYPWCIEDVNDVLSELGVPIDVMLEDRKLEIMEEVLFYYQEDINDYLYMKLQDIVNEEYEHFINEGVCL